MSRAATLESASLLLPARMPASPARLFYGFTLLTLSLQSAFVVDVGATIRVSYIVGVLAFVLALAAGRIQHPRRLRSLQYLIGFMVAVFVSTVLMTRADVPPIEIAGLRGSAWRPVIQDFQMLLMVSLLYLTMNLTRSPTELKRAQKWVIVGALFTIGYGIYEVVALARGLPYLDIRNALNTDFSLGYREQGISFEGFAIPRARATFMEPLNFANFTLFVMPLAFAALGTMRGGWRVAAWLALTAGAVTFLLTNSRGALIAAAAASVSLLAFVRGPRSFTRGLLKAAVIVLPLLVLGAIVLMRLVPGLGLGQVVDLFSRRVSVGFDDPGRVISSEAWAVFLAHPILGVGFGNLPFHLAVSSLDGSILVDAPNAYLRLLAETGVVGTAFYLMFLGSILVGLVRMVRRRAGAPDLQRFAGAIYFALLADSVQRFSFVGIATDAHLWVMLGLALAVIRMGRVGEGFERSHA